MLQIRKKAKVSLLGPMAENMKGNGKMENSMELVFSPRLKVKGGKENGKMDRGSGGCLERSKSSIIRGFGVLGF